MSRIVAISGHPNLEGSVANRIIVEALESAGMDLEVRRLDTSYPDYAIDVAAEQEALVAADVIVLQFPFYWYSVPALLKKWVDDVLAYGFAFGSTGDKLKGKDLILSATIGGPQDAYGAEGYNRFSIPELMRPLEQTAGLTGMTFQDPVVTHDMVYIPDVYNKLEGVQARARDHAARLIERIGEVVEGVSAEK